MGARVLASWYQGSLPDVDWRPDIAGQYALGADPEEPVALLMPPQLASIERFLRSREVAALVQVALLARFLNEQPRQAIADDAESTFDDLATDWCSRHNQNWGGLSQYIWQIIMSYYNAAMPADHIIVNFPARVVDPLAAHVGEPKQFVGNEHPIPGFARRLLEVAGSPPRLMQVRETVADVNNALRLTFSSMRLSHSQDDYRYSFEDLYVERFVRSRHTGATAPSQELLGPEQLRSRCVVVGDPGAGKSTLVDHLIHNLTDAQRPAESVLAPLLLRCRDYAPAANNTSLLQALQNQIEKEASLELNSDLLMDILALGRAFIIFDGVDEITDIALRRKVVDRIETLSSQYPFAPVMVTSRRIGYNKAPFESVAFDVYELQEYTEPQVVEYVGKWFRVTERGASDRDAFLRESSSISDIRTNPLMLSLLCILYRARGSIPTNRREIYRECADLLFHRWDSMRKVEQPFDHRRYGRHLMQDLAHFFSSSPSTQAGVEEQQLRGIIATFFIDTAGVQPADAQSRAADFLDFCSDRAWLLTAKGTNDRGQRLFGFTHRTFMEYFSAEAIVRRAPDLASIGPSVVSAYGRDSSSVLPDLLVQCADDKFERGAEHLIRELLDEVRRGRRSLALCLRLINSAPVSGSLTDKIFTLLFTAPDAEYDNLDTTISLFELYRDPRARLVVLADGYPRIASPAGLSIAEQVCSRWLRLRLRGEWTTFAPDWSALVDHFLEQMRHDLDAVRSPFVRSWFFAEGSLSPGKLIGRRDGADIVLLGAVAFEQPVLGLASEALLRSLTGSATERDLKLIDEMVTSVLPSCQLPMGAAEMLDAALSSRMAQFTRHEDQTISPGVMFFLLHLCFVLYEYRGRRLDDFQRFVMDVLPGNVLRRILITRNAALGYPASRQVTSIVGTAYDGGELRLALPGLPEHLRSWCFGASNLTYGSRLD